MTELTLVLARVAAKDPQASEELLPLVYKHLRILASRKLAAEKPGQTLQPTALVHEAFLRLVGTNGSPVWEHRSQFFGAAAEAMRRILVEAARRKKTVRRGGQLKRSQLELDQLTADPKNPLLLELDDALKVLEAEAPLHAKLVKLRFFVGLTLREAADALGISEATCSRHWAFSRARLYCILTDFDSGQANNHGKPSDA